MKTRLALALAILTLGVDAADQAYPPHRNVVVVTQPPYNVKGDRVSDDTEALQRALNENVGRHRVLYFPKGTYLVSATLAWPKKWNGKDNWGKTMLRGQNREQCIIRLKDAVFTDAKKPAAIMWCGGFGSADWFHNYVENLTFDVGAGNPYSVSVLIRLKPARHRGRLRISSFACPASGIVRCTVLSCGSSSTA